jgi:hypothetical protein
MKTILVLVTIIDLSGCTNNQSRLRMTPYGQYTSHGYTSPGACAAGRN